MMGVHFFKAVYKALDVKNEMSTNNCTEALTELSTSRVDPWVGSIRVGSGHDFVGFWRVGSGQHFGMFSFSLIIYELLNQCESSNTTLGLIVLLYDIEFIQ